MSVREIQQALWLLGHNPGPIDGVMGPRTRAAIRSFQAEQGLTVDGVVGPQTIAAFNAAGAGGGGGGEAAPGPDQALIDRIKSEYPAYAFLLDNPEVGPLLLAAARGEIAEDVFQSRLMATNWWKTTAESARLWYALVNTDPATADLRRKERIAQVQQMAAEFGITLDGNQINALVEQSLTMGMDIGSPLFRDMIAAAGGPGATRVSEQSLRKMADEYMIPLTDGDYQWWAKEIISGRRSVEQFQLAVSDIATSRFPVFADRIKAGESPGRIFSPYKNLIAQEMDLTPDSVNLLDAKWNQVLQTADKDGALRPMTLSETQKYVRSKDDWWKTSGGKSNAAEMTSNLLSMFGER